NLSLDALGAFMIALVDDEYVGNFHDTGFDRLHIIAHARHENHNRDIRQAYEINFILTYADRFHQDHVTARGVARGGDGARRACPLCGKRAFNKSEDSGARFSTALMTRDKARASPARKRSIHCCISWFKLISVKQT